MLRNLADTNRTFYIVYSMSVAGLNSMSSIECNESIITLAMIINHNAKKSITITNTQEAIKLLQEHGYKIYSIDTSYIASCPCKQ